MRALVLIIAGLSLCAGGASAQTANRWVHISSSNTQKMAINAANIVGTGNIKSAWFVRVLKQTHTSGYDYTVSRYSIDCANNRLRSMQGVGYSINGDVINSYDTPDEWSGVIPETVGETMVQEACNPSWGDTDGVSTITDYVRMARAIMN